MKKEEKLTPSAGRNDPYRKFNFIVEIDGIASTGFQFVDGLESASDVVDYREGNEITTPRKLPGLIKVTNIVLKRGMTTNRDLWEWRRTVLDGATERRNGLIVVLNEAREQVLRLNFRNAWPCRWKVSGLDALESQVLMEEIELVVEDLRLE
jgi:phage tail-like protein